MTDPSSLPMAPSEWVQLVKDVITKVFALERRLKEVEDLQRLNLYAVKENVNK